MMRAVTKLERTAFDRLALHPLQSWAWGKFRELLGQKVVRLGRFEGKKLVETAQFSVHRIPHTPLTVGYLPRAGIPSREMIEAVREEAKKLQCIFVKFEPHVLLARGARPFGLLESERPRSRRPELMVEGREARGNLNDSAVLRASRFTLRALGLRPGRSLFTPFTFQIDLRKSEQELLAAMKPKTRYNIKVAEKHGVEVIEDNSEEAFEAFQKLTDETTKRQRFFAHDRRYRQLMWQSMRDAGIARLLTARYLAQSSRAKSRDLAKRSGKTEVLTAWILFFFNGVSYYPYGASSSEHRELMASNLLAWRALQLAKAAGCHTFDFWGALGPNPDSNDPWYGFHRFKEGYGGALVEFVGTWDLVIDPFLYRLYGLADQVRWWMLRRR